MMASPFCSRPSPVTDYPAAVEGIRKKQAEELATPGFNPELQSILLTHGRKTRRAVLFLHGYCVAPPYFKTLAEMCFRNGLNAFIPCAPHHGFQDRLTGEVSRLEAVELVRFTDAMVDLARGLGDELVVAGMSMGGTLTAWAAGERSDIAMAIALEPFLGARIIPTWLTPLAFVAVRNLPDLKLWWDPVRKEAGDGEPYGYPRYSLRSLGHLGRVSRRVLRQARRQPPRAGRVWVVLNEADQDVNNALVQRLAEAWHAAGARNVVLHRFPEAWGVPHDCLSEFQPGGNPPRVRAELMKLILSPAPGADGMNRSSADG